MVWINEIQEIFPSVLSTPLSAEIKWRRVLQTGKNYTWCLSRDDRGPIKGPPLYDRSVMLLRGEEGVFRGDLNWEHT